MLLRSPRVLLGLLASALMPAMAFSWLGGLGEAPAPKSVALSNTSDVRPAQSASQYVGIPSRWSCDDAPAVTADATALPAAYATGKAYGSAFDIRRDERGLTAAVTFLTYDERGRPVWYRTPMSSINPDSLEWRAQLYRHELSAEGRRTAVIAGGVSLRFLEDDANKVAIRWRIGDNAEHETCVTRAAGIGESEGYALSGSDRVELIRTPLASGGERLTVLGFDVNGAAIWTTGTRADASSEVPLTYVRASYHGEAGATSCTTSSCLQTRAAGTLRGQLVDTRNPQLGVSIEVPGTANDQAVSIREPAQGQGEARALRFFFPTLTPPNGVCLIQAPATSCTVKVEWQGADPQSTLFTRRLDPYAQQWIPEWTAQGSIVQGGWIQHDIVIPANAGRVQAGVYLGAGDANGPHGSLLWESTLQAVDSGGGGPGPGAGNPIGVGEVASCRDPNAPPVSPGQVPFVPGRWFDPQSSSNGWDLGLFNADQNGQNLNSLIATWFTYEGNGAPTVLFTDAVQLGSTQQVVNGQWQTVAVAEGILLRATWDYWLNQPGSIEQVGRVSFAFVPGDPTRARVRWRWNAAGSTVREHCLSEISRYGVRNPIPVNPTFAGLWHERHYSGYVVAPYLASPLAGTSLDEYLTLGVYDNQGRSRWVQGVVSNPQTSSTTFALNLHQSPFSGGFPIGSPTCVPPNCPTQSAGFATRSYNADGMFGQLRLNVQVGSVPGGGSIAWQRGPGAASDIGIEKLTRFDQVFAHQQRCTLGENRACDIRISWNSQFADARVFRENLSTGTFEPVGSSSRGDVIQPFTTQGNFRYRLVRYGQWWGPLLSTTAEVVIRPAPCVPTLTAPASAGNIFSVSWSLPNNCSTTPVNYELQWAASANGPWNTTTLNHPTQQTTLTVGGNGTWHTRIRSCAGAPVNCSAWSAARQTVVGIVGVPDAPVPVPGNSVDLFPHQPGDLPTDIRAEVAGGAGSATVPFVVPPGRNGMQPDLSLTYSSSAGSGIAGMGWSMSGGMSIHRCIRTLDQDGVAQPVRLDQSDALCLDGQRLLRVGGSAYGQSGAIYRTEIDSFARVTQIAGTLESDTSPTSTPAAFLVEFKDGRQAWFGAAAPGGEDTGFVVPVPQDGQPARPSAWLLVRVADRVGNTMDYSHQTFGAGETLLQRIRYTGYVQGNSWTAGNREVIFEYEPRPSAAGNNDQGSSYLAGALTQSTQRLKTVRTVAVGQNVAEYRLEYSPSRSSNRSLLRSVTHCATEGANNWTCRRPALIDWQEREAAVTTASAMQFKRFPSLEPLVNVARGAFPPPPPVIRQLGDINGDGSIEYTYSRSDSPNLYLLQFGADRSVSSVGLAQTGLPSDFQFLDTPVVGDLDGDGVSEFFGDVQSGGAKKIVRAVSSTLGSNSLRMHDFDLLGPGNVASMSPALASHGYGVELADFNGDGRADLVVTQQRNLGDATDICTTDMWILLNDSSVIRGAAPDNHRYRFQQSAYRCLARVTTSPGNFDYERLERIVDLNGDGHLDLLLKRPWIESQYDSVPLGRGDGTFEWRNASNVMGSILNGAKNADAVTFVDINGDGLLDYYRFTDGLHQVAVNRGHRGSLTSAMSLFGPLVMLQGDLPPFEYLSGADQTPIRVGDVNADGKQEILFPSGFAARICVEVVDGTEADFFYCPVHPLRVPDLLRDRRSLSVADSARASFVPGQPSQLQSIRRNGDGVSDRSLYTLDAMVFEQTGPESFLVRRVATGQITGPTDDVGDLFGDGLNDSIVQLLMSTRDAIPLYGEDFARPVNSPSTFPDGLAIAHGLYLSENLGISRTQLSADNKTPLLPDMVSGVRHAPDLQGQGWQVRFRYYPLSSSAGRTLGETPLYQIPPVNSPDRYTDVRHILFSSSMPVVAEFEQSNGVGGSNLRKYGYGQAMYHHRGRGMRGFRTIVVEDEAADLRTTTTFHQKYPLSSAIEREEQHQLSNGTPLKRTSMQWGCNRANRNDTAACAQAAMATAPTAPVWPHLLESVVENFDLASGNAVTTTHTHHYDPAQTSAGYDTYGNALIQITAVTEKPADEFGSYTTRQTWSYDAADEGIWWLDRLSVERTEQRATSTSTLLSTVPTRTKKTVWNADRTLKEVIEQENKEREQVKRSFEYPTPNYGLPNKETLDAAYALIRTSQMLYTPDGYFVAELINPLLQRSTVVTRARDGQVASATDPNGVVTTTLYDVFGTPTEKRVTKSGQFLQPPQQMAITGIGNASGAECPCVAVSNVCPSIQTHTVLSTVADGSPSTRACMDLLGRTIRTSTRLLDGTWSHVDEVYNARGLKVGQSTPWSIVQSPRMSEFKYDVLARMTEKKEPAPNGVTRKVSYAHSMRETTITATHDGGCGPSTTVCTLTMSREVDGLGRYRRVTDALGGTTRYEMDGAGNVVQIVNARNQKILAEYDDSGRRLTVDDPDAGLRVFVYNGLGELTLEKDARNIETTHEYDLLGRPRLRYATYALQAGQAAQLVVDQWFYDPPSAIGALFEERRVIGGLEERKTVVRYDVNARPYETTVTQRTSQNVTSAVTTVAYDGNYGRVKQRTEADTSSVWLHYSRYGQLVRETNPGSDPNAASLITYRQVQTVDARGLILTERLGPVQATYQHSADTGQLTSMQYRRASDQAVLRQLSYGYDLWGNVTSQTVGGVQETLQYDALHRLKQTTRPGQPTVSYDHDVLGNLKKKTDFSVDISAAVPNPYAYPTTNNRLGSVQTPAGLRTFSYDANGNLTGDSAGYQAIYDATNRPTSMTKGGVTNQLRYGADGSRAWSSGTDGEVVWFGAYEVILSRPGVSGQKTKTYLSDTVILTRGGGENSVVWMLKDRLGSADAIVDADGQLLETRAHDAYGKPRSGSNADLAPARLQEITRTSRGFTQHEHLNSLELIHMNGRVFDYHLGRFHGVDPVIQFPTNSQSLNPYSYLMNNPLSGTDPTGYMAACRDVSPTQSGTSGSCTSGGEKYDYSFDENGQMSLSGGAATRYVNFVNARNGTTGDVEYTGREFSGNVASLGSPASRDGNRCVCTESQTFGVRDQTAARITDLGSPTAPVADKWANESQLLEDIADGVVVYREGVRGRYENTNAFSYTVVATVEGFFLAPVEDILRNAAKGDFTGAFVAVTARGAGRTFSQACLVCRCFAAGTLILTEDGLRAIETIEVGDVVASRNEATGELTWQPVQEVYVNLHRDVIEMSFGSSAKDVEKLVVTHEHPFHTRDGRWVPAGDLKIGDEVMTRDGSWLALQQVVDIPDNVSTHNFMVADDHNYFVGRSGLWVHNCCGGLWTATRRSTAAQNAYRHFLDHGADFGAKNAVEYAKMAKDFLHNPGATTLTITRRSNGDIVRFDPSNNFFGVMDRNGTPRTFYKPDPAVHGYPSNLEYFRAQQ
jgi:RHS repeat-associated protein